MSQRIPEQIPEEERTKLWWVHRLDQPGGHLFAGDLRAAIDHINELHLKTGVQHATSEFDG